MALQASAVALQASLPGSKAAPQTRPESENRWRSGSQPRDELAAALRAMGTTDTVRATIEGLAGFQLAAQIKEATRIQDLVRSLPEGLGTASLARSLDAAGLARGLGPSLATAGLTDAARFGLAEQATTLRAIREAGLHQATVAGSVDKLQALMSEMESPAIIAAQEAMERHLQDVARVTGAADYLRTPLAAKGFPTPDTAARLLAKQTITGRASDLVATTSYAEQALSFTVPRVPAELVELLERDRELDTSIERFAERFEDTTLWFLLSIISVRLVSDLLDLDSHEVEAVLLDGLEAVVTEGAFVRALIAGVQKAPYLSSDQREDLCHGLGHAERAEFVKAMPSLMTGLEGAIWSTARDLTIVDPQTRQLVRTPQRRHLPGIELVVKELPAPPEYQKFVRARVFGNRGNPVRHGEQSDRRRHALFAIVAVVGWLDAFAEGQARNALGRLLNEALGTSR